MKRFIRSNGSSTLHDLCNKESEIRGEKNLQVTNSSNYYQRVIEKMV